MQSRLFNHNSSFDDRQAMDACKNPPDSGEKMKKSSRRFQEFVSIDCEEHTSKKHSSSRCSPKCMIAYLKNSRGPPAELSTHENLGLGNSVATYVYPWTLADFGSMVTDGGKVSRSQKTLGCIPGLDSCHFGYGLILAHLHLIDYESRRYSHVRIWCLTRVS